MSDLSCFLAENAERKENKKVIISERFKDQDGNPVPWEIRPLCADEDAEIRNACTKRVQVPGKAGKFTKDLDADAYLGKLAARVVVYPNLNSKELQESYHVLSAEQLLKKMLYKDEYDKLSVEVLDLNEDEDINELVGEAKN